MKYFAYGSNMSLARIRARAPGAEPLGHCVLSAHALRFHKVGRDGSGKCDAYFTGDPSDRMYGVLFEIGAQDKRALDVVEGLGRGYEQKKVVVMPPRGGRITAVTYVATAIDPSLEPFSWYVLHVLVGAQEAALPPAYVDTIRAVSSRTDSYLERDRVERSLHL